MTRRAGIVAGVAFILAAAPWSASAAPPRKGTGPNVKAQCLAAHEDAQSLRSQKKPHAAHDRFVECAKSECPSVVRKECAQQLDEVEQEEPSVALEAHDADGHDTSAVVVSLDGTKIAERLNGGAVDVEPGEHDFKFDRADGKTLTVHVLIVEGEKNRKVLADFATLEQKPTGSSASSSSSSQEDQKKTKPAEVPVASFVLGGVAVVALGSWSYFGLTGKSDEHSLARTCGPHCTDQEIHPVKTSYLAADISLVVAIAAVATAVVLAWPAITGARVQTASVSGPPPWMPRVRWRALP